MARKIRLASIILFFAALFSNLANANAYTFTDLGANWRPTDINNIGQVVGYDSDNWRAMSWNKGSLQVINPLSGGAYAAAHSINDSGQIVGWSTFDSTGASHATLWGSNGITDLGTNGGTNSGAYGINNSGQVVGWVTIDNYQHATTWNNGVATDISGGAYNWAQAINNSGMIAGYASVWSNGVSQDIGSTVAYGVNDLGQVVGNGAFIWQDGLMKTLGSTQGAAYGINNLSQVVGCIYDPIFGGTGTHAALWENNNTIDLNNLLSDIGWTLWEANSINDYGQIVGYGVNSLGQHGGFLLTPDAAPVPEPSTFLLLGAGLLGVGIYRRKMNKS